MAERRMFAKTIIDSDAFLDMSLSTQALYFHLSMRADDDGFVNNPKKIQRMIGCGDDELKMLVAKKFIIPFESGVCVIKHWRIHNYIQKDRYKETVYKDEKSHLMLKENNAYRYVDTECIQDVSKLETQVRLGKDSLELGESSLEEDSIRKEKKKSEFDLLIENYTDDLDLRNTIYEFIKMRKAIKAPMTSNALNLMLKKLDKLAPNDIHCDIRINILEQSIMNSWKGIFELKSKNGQKQVQYSNEKPKLRFNNFKGRDYDYDDLEKKLLGWDEESEED
ncbi:phage replication initiation protein [Clostridium tertium]|uniref:phage replication initiation protein n=1 Tax=Clostridium tertium TaxID=1559 RepID=UPI00232B3EC1|nr:phage replication initiation protein [Clostridium tertium]MDB1935362.1 phage replication initiation protein [Clostridium tertium]MDB1939122.1 phage replication initiation protein [Clostridium tertium]